MFVKATVDSYRRNGISFYPGEVSLIEHSQCRCRWCFGIPSRFWTRSEEPTIEPSRVPPSTMTKVSPAQSDEGSAVVWRGFQKWRREGSLRWDGIRRLGVLNHPASAHGWTTWCRRSITHRSECRCWTRRVWDVGGAVCGSWAPGTTGYVMRFNVGRTFNEIDGSFSISGGLDTKGASAGIWGSDSFSSPRSWPERTFQDVNIPSQREQKEHTWWIWIHRAALPQARAFPRRSPKLLCDQSKEAGVIFGY